MPGPPEVVHSFAVRAVTNPFTTWFIRNVAAKVDPWLYRKTNGRFFSMGPGNDAMVTITMIGRRSGKPRSVHLTCVPHEGDLLVVASAMGQARHPGWRYNLEANPNIELQRNGERYRARATLLSDDEKKAVWDRIREQVPMIYVYEDRTNRNIRVFRLARIDSEA